jgi:hypothetical protein
MKKLFLSIILVIIPLFIFSQDHIWDGSEDNNWSTAGNWSTNSVPNSNTAQVVLATTGSSGDIVNITLDMNATVGRIKVTSAGTENISYKITGDGTGKILTIGGTSPPTEIITIAKVNSDIHFNCNVTIAGGNDPQVLRNYTSGYMYFGAGKTLTLNENIKIQGDSSKLLNVVFSGTNVMSDNTKSIMLFKRGSLKWETTYIGAGFLGSISIGDINNLANSQGNSATVQGKLEAKDFYLSKASICTIAETGSVVLSGAATVQSGQTGHFLLKSTKTDVAALIAPNTTSEAVRVRFRKNMDATQIGSAAREWNLVGVPLTGEEVDDVHALNTQLQAGSGAQAGKTSLAKWDPATSTYAYQSATATGNYLVGGKGYAVSPAATGAVEFRGFFQEAAVTRALVDGAGAYGNWNLLGNPFSSYLNTTDDSGDATNNFLTVNAAKIHADYGAIYSWNGTIYKVHNHATDGKDYAAPGEGFFIHVVDDVTGNASFTEAMQNASPAQRGNFNAGIVRDDVKREATFKIKMEDQENNDYDYVDFFFSDESTKGLDFGYDAGKFFMSSKSKIYTRLVEEDKGTDFQLQALAYDDLKDVVVPLGITTKSSSIKLSIKENTIDHLYRVYLEDRLKNTIVEFDDSIDLNFENNSTEAGRFYLHFTEGMIPELPTDGDDFRIFKVSNSELRLMGSPETNYSAKVYDFSGRLVREVNFTHRVNINEIDSRGINILTIESKDQKLTKKFKLN